MRLRVGIDVGGTFTDVTAFDEDRGELVAVRKYLSDPAEPAAVMEAITADLARDFGAEVVALILHGSTAALNTLLEGRGVKVGLLTTRGFRDVYEIGRQWRGENVFNLFAPAPRMLLTRERIFEQGVERGGRAVQDQRDRVRAEIAREIRGDRLHHGDGIRRIGAVFAHRDELATLLVEGGDVGERPAHIDADPQSHRLVLCPRRRAVASASRTRSGPSTTP